MPCPHAGPDGLSCSHEFSHEQLRERIRCHPPLDTVECPVHLRPLLDVRQLLQGIEPPAPEESIELARAAVGAVQRMEHAVQQQGADLAEQLRLLRVQQQSVAAEQQRAFLSLLRAQRSMAEVVCPRVVWALPVRLKLGKVMPVKKLQLHLGCEAPGAWHRLTGVTPYEVRLTSDLAKAVAPYVRRLLTVLKYVVPVAGAAVGIASEDLAKHFKGDIETMEALIEGLPDALGSDPNVPDHLRGASSSAVYADGDAAIRAMQKLLLKVDPQRKWAGLNKVLTAEGDVYWLCIAHTAEYRGLPGNAVR